MSINRVVLTGRLTKDADLRSTTSGMDVASFTLAVDNPVSKNSAASSASFISCVAWDQRAKFVTTYCKKGSLVAIDGRLQQRSYDGKNGKVYVTEVICERIENLTPRDASQSQNTAPTVNNNNDEDDADTSFSDDDLPF